jgi:hypothetical protein
VQTTPATRADQAFTCSGLFLLIPVTSAVIYCSDFFGHSCWEGTSDTLCLSRCDGKYFRIIQGFIRTCMIFAEVIDVCDFFLSFFFCGKKNDIPFGKF